MKQIEVVAAAIVDCEKVFAAERGYGEFKGFWEFPGGKIEPGESEKQALKREILEEFNSQIEVFEKIAVAEYKYSSFFLKMHIFRCRLLSGKLELLEHKKSKWISKNEFDSVNWLPADKMLIPKIREILQNEQKNCNAEFISESQIR